MLSVYRCHTLSRKLKRETYIILLSITCENVFFIYYFSFLAFSSYILNIWNTCYNRLKKERAIQLSPSGFPSNQKLIKCHLSTTGSISVQRWEQIESYVHSFCNKQNKLCNPLVGILLNDFTL